MQTWMITGGAGFIGSNFIHYIVNKYGNSIGIVNIDKLTYAGNLQYLSDIENQDNYIFIRADINDRKQIFDAFARYKPDIVVNFAAETHVDRSINDPTVFALTNIIGTQTLLEAAIKYPVARFIQISTDEVYGALGTEGYFSEASPLNPSSPYSASKAGADLMVSAFGKTYGLAWNITRCTNNYGHYQYPEKLIPLVIKSCLINQNIPIYGNGSNIRDWIWVYDHCRAVEMVVNQGTKGQIYNIGASCEISNIELVQMIINEVRKQIPPNDWRREKINPGLITYVKDRKGHDFRYALNTNKISAEIGWKPEVNLREGIRATVKWYLKNEGVT